MGRRGGLIALGIFYIIGGALVIIDGPAPFGDAAAIALYLLIPDAAVYAVGSFAEDALLGESSAPYFGQQSPDGVRYYV